MAKKKFEVKVFEVHSYTVEVEAEDTWAAKVAVNKMLEAGELMDKPTEYSHTMGLDDWDVFHLGRAVATKGHVAMPPGGA